MNQNFNNGLHGFSIHEVEDNSNAIKNINSSFETKTRNMAIGTIPKPEETALFYLEKAFDSKDDSLSNFNKPETSEKCKVHFEPFQSEDSPFTENKTIKFRQKINNVSVYGSYANVELDKDYNLVSINSSLAPNIGVSTIAKISAKEALENAEAYINNVIPSSTIPLLYLYFLENQWRLVYIIKHVISKRENDAVDNKDLPKSKYLHQHGLPNYVDVVIDATTGEVLKEKPKVMSLTTSVNISDYIIPQEQPLRLVNQDYNVYTYDLNFLRYDIDGNLPGSEIIQNGSDWLDAGVYAHYHACLVSKFLKDVLRRNGIDNKGMKLISTVQCVDEDGVQEWNNAAWLSGLNQMVYGQILKDGNLRSLAYSLDVVGHEILHGVTNYTANLDYENEPGALNESYSDIFGILISNYANKDRTTWNWQLGEETSGVPFRDISDPTKYDQPDHMNNYQNLPNNRWGDWGGVHINSGIHNKAAYNLITAKNSDDEYIFEIDEAAVLFYLGLIQLSNVSGFSDSYRSLLNAANSLFRNSNNKDQKKEALKQAFANVGIH